MVVLRDGKTVTVHAPAKLNLHLEILARRADGFHEIETLMVPLSLYDTLTLSPHDSQQIELRCNWTSGLTARFGDSLGDLPATQSNIIYRAVELLQRESGYDRGAKIIVTKRIPSQAGLGGASSDAAAALLAANELWQLGWSRERLAELSSRLGSDIPFFFYDGAAVCRGRGEQIESLGRVPPIHVVMVRPPEGLSTPAVYKKCRVAAVPISASVAVEALRRGDADGLGRVMVNRLQEPAEQISPWIEKMSEAFSRTDCLGHQMSGSGSSYFGIGRTARHARRIAARLEAANLGYVAWGVAGGAA